MIVSVKLWQSSLVIFCISAQQIIFVGLKNHKCECVLIHCRTLQSLPVLSFSWMNVRSFLTRFLPLQGPSMLERWWFVEGPVADTRCYVAVCCHISTWGCSLFQTWIRIINFLFMCGRTRAALITSSITSSSRWWLQWQDLTDRVLLLTLILCSTVF